MTISRSGTNISKEFWGNSVLFPDLARLDFMDVMKNRYENTLEAKIRSLIFLSTPLFLISCYEIRRQLVDKKEFSLLTLHRL